MCEAVKFTQPLNLCWSEQMRERKEHWIWIMFTRGVRSVSLIEPRVKSTQSSFLTLQSHFEFYFDLLCDLRTQWVAVEHLSIWINLRSKQNQSPSSHLSCVIEVRLLITWSRAFNCSPCEAFFLFIGWDQLCLSCSWGVHSRTITRMKEFEIQPRIVDTVFTPGFWKMTKDWKCLQDDNKFHHGRQRAYCGEAGLSPPPHSAMLLCWRCVQVQRSSKQSLLPTKANSEAEGWCAFATCSATLSNSSIFVQRRPFQRVFYSIRFSGMVS